MTELVLLPDAEQMSIVALASHPAVVAFDAAVGTRKTTLPALVVTRIGGVPRVTTRLDKPRLDIEAWAERRDVAHDLAVTAYAVAHAMPAHAHAGAVVTAVRDFLGLSWRPDPATATPVFLFTVELTVHPLPWPPAEESREWQASTAR